MILTKSTNLCFGSFNCKGFKSSEECIKELFAEVDFLAVQEHWLLSCSFNLFSSVADDCVYRAISPMESDEIRFGRPFGGVALLWHRRLQHVVVPVQSASDRIVAIKLLSEEGAILIISVYMPTNYRDRSSYEDYISELGFLEGLLEFEHYDHVVILGDFNADLRFLEGRFSAKLSSFVSDHKLSALGLDDNSAWQWHTWHSHDFSSQSWIDYILTSQQLEGLVTDVQIRDGESLTSDHWPVVMYANIGVSGIERKKEVPGCLQWNYAKESDFTRYRECLKRELDQLEIHAETAICNDPGNCGHEKVIQQFVDQLVGIVLKSATKTIPKSKRRRYRRPGWNETLKNLKNEAIEAYRVWKGNGKQRFGYAFRRMKESRKAFRKQLKSVQRQEAIKFKDKLARDLTSDDQVNFWKRIKNGFRPDTTRSSTRIGNATSNCEIMKVWIEHFRQLVNSECPIRRENERLLFEEALKQKMSDTVLPWWCVDISYMEVQRAVQKLKVNKSAGPDAIQSEHLKHGGPLLHIYMSVAFTAMVRHSYVPTQFRSSYLVPIVKDKKGDKSDPENYRGIAVSSVLAKAFEYVLLRKVSHCMAPCDQQFGFRRGHSCSDCSFVLKETVNYYLSNGNRTVYSCALDLSKAYDRVSHFRLFRKLVERENALPVYFVRLLSFWYSVQEMYVKWEGNVSSGFGVRNGVRQGSALSPSLFNLYIDDLLQQLQSCGVGARFGRLYLGCLVYADDITLVSPTVSGMQEMLNICQRFTQEHGLLFNSKKSVATTFVRSRHVRVADPEFILAGNALSHKTEFRHLGLLVDSRYRDSVSVEDRIRKFFSAVNGVVSRLGGCCYNDGVWLKLVESQLLPILSFGSHLWSIEKPSIARLVNTAYRKGVRRGLGMSQRDSISERLGSRFVEASEVIESGKEKYLARAVNSPSRLVMTFARVKSLKGV